MFSNRATWNLTDNAWAARVAAKRRAGAALLDLTNSKPTRCGFDYSKAGMDKLADPGQVYYRPEPHGLPTARAAVAAYYATHGVPVDLNSVILTASTSEAYSYLFKLLADPGESILAPVPSYP